MPTNGSPLENEVYRLLRGSVAANRLGLNAECTQVRLHPTYYSLDRCAWIEVDVALEMTLPGDEIPTLIWIWECKDYGRRLGVEDVEEFYSKLEQIGARNCHGTIVSPSGFQSGAIAYANSKRIGLVRFERRKMIHEMKNETSLHALDPLAVIAELVKAGIAALRR